MAGTTTDPFNFDVFAALHHLLNNSIGMLRKNSHGREHDMKGNDFVDRLPAWFEATAQERFETPERSAPFHATERAIHTTKGFEIHGLLTHALPFFIMAVMALLALFRMG